MDTCTSVIDISTRGKLLRDQFSTRLSSFFIDLSLQRFPPFAVSVLTFNKREGGKLVFFARSGIQNATGQHNKRSSSEGYQLVRAIPRYAPSIN